MNTQTFMLNGVAYRPPKWYDKIYQTVLVLLVIISSGFPMFVNNRGLEMLILAIAICGSLYYRPNLKMAALLSLLFALIMVTQAAWFGVFYFRTAIYQTLLFVAASVTVSILGISLIYTFNKIMLVIAALATILFIPIYIDPNFANKLISISPVHIQTATDLYGWKTVSHNIFVMHFPPAFFMGLTRNSGPFWEPGAFGGFLLLALMFNTLLHHTIYRKENLIYLAAMISTFSTTTYLALLFFITAYYFIKIRNPLISWGSLVVFLLISFTAFQKIDFLGEKIGTEIKEVKYQALMKGGDTRMASAYLDLKEITENSMYIFFGRGSHPDTRIGLANKEVIRTNGITDLLSRFGIFFFSFTLWALYKSFKHIASAGPDSTQLAVIALTTTVILTFSEIYFIYLFFKMLTLFYITTLHPKQKMSPIQHRDRRPYQYQMKATTI